MYNTEKYVGECLESILAQTFQDFEVIIIDDCSTDESCAVIESYIPKFTKEGIERLKLIRLEKHTGFAGTPRNTGLKVARGEYIFFVDSDDIITENALEEMYGVAKKFDADVVACQKWYETPMNGDVKDKDSLNIKFPLKAVLFDETTPVTNDLQKRVEQLNQRQFVWSACMKIVRRNFIFENNLEILDMLGEDAIFAICLICSNSKYYHVPMLNYIYRKHSESSYHKNDTVENIIHKWGTTLTLGFNYLNDFLSRQEFFQQNPAIKFSALEVVVSEFSEYFLMLYGYVPNYNIENFKEIRAEFENCKNLPEFTAFLFNRINILTLTFRSLQLQNQKMQTQLQQAADFLKKQQEIIKQLENKIR